MTTTTPVVIEFTVQLFYAKILEKRLHYLHLYDHFYLAKLKEITKIQNILGRNNSEEQQIKSV